MLVHIQLNNTFITSNFTIINIDFLRKTDMLPNIKVCCLHIPQILKIAHTTNFTFRNILPLVFIFSLFGRNFHICLTIYNYEENHEKCLSW